MVAKALGRATPATHGLDLEITESLLMEDIEANIDKLHALKEMGVNIAIDDFGTGYSSLSYLAQLPVDALKIDRSFIMTMVDKPQSMTIVSTIISLAHALRMRVIAEGVETRSRRSSCACSSATRRRATSSASPCPGNECFEPQP